VVNGGAAADIRAAIFGSVAAGIETYGTVSGTVTANNAVRSWLLFVFIFFSFQKVVDVYGAPCAHRFCSGEPC
jgi:hypothetical protein